MTANEQGGTIGISGKVFNAGTFYNDFGTVEISQGALLENYVWATFANRGGTVTNSGKISNSELFSSDGDFFIEEGAEFINEASRSLLLNYRNLENSGLIQNGLGYVKNYEQLTIRPGGSLINNGGTVYNHPDVGDIHNYGTIDNLGGGTVENHNKITNYPRASLNNRGESRIMNEVASASILNRGYILNENSGIVNMGLIRHIRRARLDNRGLIWSKARFVLRSGSTLDNVGGTMLNFCNARLRNNGTIDNTSGTIHNYSGSVTGTGAFVGNPILNWWFCIS